jgi:ribosomal protein L11 methyltransferase
MGDPATGNALEASVICDAEAVEAVAELFAEYGFDRGIVVEAALPLGSDGDTAVLASGTPVTVRSVLSSDVPPEELEDVRHSLWNLRQALWVLGRSRPIGALEIIERQEGWTDAWKANFSLHRVGNRILVKAPWHEYVPQPDEIVIELDPGPAFGTGKHASTRLCMQALEEELNVGDAVLDVGIGSGALATAAALLGARTVDGVDIDPNAVRAARATAERNGVGGVVRIALGSLGPNGPIQGPVDLVVANIIARVLIELAPDLAHQVAPGGTLILGGIIDTKEVFVHEAFAATNLTLVRRTESEDWVALVWRKPA